MKHDLFFKSENWSSTEEMHACLIDGLFIDETLKVLKPFFIDLKPCLPTERLEVVIGGGEE